ncbi:glutathione synthase [Photobacterium kishitanii]|uniref:glutathione synthase n=1 Tax=Photobacterium kishitanii TaxID=318456 RepID=UPI000D15FD09|nr:glutathione synthase [Photobacterium kishitanii]PSW71154.1 glutathione synthase [Photobacterium kishitanii]
MNNNNKTVIAQQVIEDICEWAIMHGVAFRQADNTARHCPFSIAPMTIEREVYDHLRRVVPVLTKLITNVSEDYDFLQASLADMAKADPFFGRLMSLHYQIHGDVNHRYNPARQPLLLMRTDFMDDRQYGAKVIEFNGIAAGMAPFGQRATELHHFIQHQWPEIYQAWLEDTLVTPADNQGLAQLAHAITTAAHSIKADFNDQGAAVFLMVVQKNEDNVYDQHLLEAALQRQGLRTVRRTFEQLSAQLSTGAGQRLMLEGVGAVDVVYLRAGYQYCDYCAPELNEAVCCYTLSQMRVFIEQHHVALNATIGQQLATSKTMQMLLTMMPAQDYIRWGLTLAEAELVKSVLAEMKPITAATIDWFNTQATKTEWVLKNQGEGGGHCVFGNDISDTLAKLTVAEYDAWALMQRLYPHEREVPTIAIRDAKMTVVEDLVSEIGLFSAYFNGKPVTELGGYAGYLIRSKPASENEGGIHSGKGILDSLVLID